MRALLTLLLALLLGSCKAPSVQYVPMPSQDSSLEDRSLARIYLIRRPQTYGRLRMVRGFENTRLIGRIRSDKYLCWETNAGRKLLSAVYERRPVDGGDIEGVLDLLCEPGQVYYIGVQLDSNRMGHPRLSLLEEIEGQRLLKSQAPATRE